VGRAGFDGHLFDLWHDGARWRQDDVTVLGRDLASSMPAATHCPCVFETGNGIGIAFRGVGGAIWVVDRSTNSPSNLSTVAGGVSAIGGPVCFVAADGPHIIYRGNDSFIYDVVLHEASWRAQQVCGHTAATDPAADGDGARGASAWRTPDGNIHLAHFGGTQWACA
jgi:hypothetical protein